MIDIAYFRNRMNGTCAMDYCDEYYWTGNYECIISRPYTNHNYYIKIDGWRENGGKAKSWSANVHQALSCSNSRSIDIGHFKNRTLKGIINQIVDTINEYDREIKPQKLLNWMEENRKPVFIIKDKKIVILGSSYTGSGKEMEDSLDDDKKEKWLYFHDDIPNYNQYKDFMILDKSLYGNKEFYISNVKNMGCGYSQGGLREEDFNRIGLAEEEVIKIVREIYLSYLDTKYIAEIRKN